jgi:nucleotide-binding universal stress UspA family protein
MTSVWRARPPAAVRPTLVGVSGSPQGIDAALWAAADAARRAAPVELIHVCETDRASVSSTISGVYVEFEAAEDGAQIVAEAARAVQALFPEVPVTGRVCRGDSGAVLGRLSSDAEMVVVGSPRRGPEIAGAAGAARLARTSRAPVVMVSQKIRAQRRAEREPAPVAVILESARDATRIVEWASTYAARERRAVRVILSLRRRDYRRATERCEAEVWLFDLLNGVRGRTRHFGLSGTTQQADNCQRPSCGPRWWPSESPRSSG